MVRAAPFDGAGPSAPVYRAAIESADDARITIDFPPTPDDVRLRSQTMSRLSQAGCVSGLVGLAVTVLGVAGLAGSAYFAVQAATDVERTRAAEQDRWGELGLSGGLSVLSSLVVTFGLSQVCLCVKARRRAEQEWETFTTRVQFEPSRAGERS
ncbi:hypothetical protein [Pandoraea anhela]|uniref:Transmembrane protein n=1 Tax=Pandoraea anhela TaxID=2508295 RepID=A0A5E4WYF4_9BURK|nr:hypothetical protein [Pandoraea anhela]VVE28215.1 hypothetical protein PAN31108_03493 [Pandoraea anhela]